MTAEEFYGEYFPSLKAAEETLLRLSHEYCKNYPKSAIQPVSYRFSRIKTPESMSRKLEKNHLEATVENALAHMYDTVGLRLVCSFVEEVYRIADWLKHRPELRLIAEKDYIAYPKPNGYRSLHLQVDIAVDRPDALPPGSPAPSKESGLWLHGEIQLRTIAIDFWATLEHQLKYKQEVPHEKLIRRELKRCADEIASIDLSMQTIRDLIDEGW